MRTGKAVHFRDQGKDIKVIDSFFLLQSIINNNGFGSKMKEHDADVIDRAWMKDLENTFKWNDVSTETKIIMLSASYQDVKTGQYRSQIALSIRSEG